MNSFTGRAVFCQQPIICFCGVPRVMYGNKSILDKKTSVIKQEFWGQKMASVDGKNYRHKKLFPCLTFDPQTNFLKDSSIKGSNTKNCFYRQKSP